MKKPIFYFFYMAFLVLVLAGCRTARDSAGNKVEKKTRNKVLFAVYLKAIRVESFPKYDRTGEAWDAYAPFAMQPDIYATIMWNEHQVYKSETIEECVFGKPLVFSSGLPADLKPFDQPLAVEVFDEDGVSSNDNMGYFSMSLLDYKDWNTVVLSSDDNTLKVVLELEWVYQ